MIIQNETRFFLKSKHPPFFTYSLFLLSLYYKILNYVLHNCINLFLFPKVPSHYCIDRTSVLSKEWIFIMNTSRMWTNYNDLDVVTTFELKS